MNTKKTLTITKKDLELAAERAGELCVAGIPKNFKIWIEELREKHPGYTYNEVYNAYRLATQETTILRNQDKFMLTSGTLKTQVNFTW